MSQSERPSCVIGVWHQVADLTAPVNLNHIPGNIAAVYAERRTMEPGLRYDLSITYHDDGTPAPVHRELVRVSSDRDVCIRAEWVQTVGFTQERPSATQPAALVVMCGQERPLMHLSHQPVAKSERNPEIANPQCTPGQGNEVYYVKPDGGDYAWLTEYAFLGNGLHTRQEGLGYYRVQASCAMEALQVVRNHFNKATVTAAKVDQTKKRTYLQFDELEPGKVYQGFCLEEQTPRNLFEVGENPVSGKAVRAVGGRMWMGKEDMRPFVYLELNLVPYAEAIEEYNAQQGKE